ncbi:MAG: PD-(D/E)XK nuclease family protein [Candidatus Zixiibacteriota bacterium]
MESIGRYKCLLEKVALVQEHARARQRESASDFNIFRVLGLERAEVRTHSAFLAELLNPHGSHGQGALFLKAFLRLCSEIAKDVESCEFEYSDESYDDCTVETEKFAREVGRLDIFLHSVKNATIIGIENKIDAEESEGQLKKYWDYMVGQYSSTKQKLLVLLNPIGSPSTSAEGASHIVLSYKVNIDQMLDCCRAGIPEKLKSVIDQYQNVIRQICGEIVMTEEQKQLASLLEKNENLRAAFEIYDAVERILADRLREMWDRIEQIMNDLVKSDPNWKVERLTYKDDRQKGEGDNWFGLGWANSDSVAEKPLMRFTISQSLSGGNIEMIYGLSRTSVDMELPNFGQEFTSLKEALKMTSRRQTDWFPLGYDNIPELTASKRILLSNLDCVERQVVDVAWKRFESVRNDLLQLNRIWGQSAGSTQRQ